MSRLTKYLRQSATLSRVQRSTVTGEPVLDLYGEPLYEPQVQVRCRRERVIKDVLTQTGAVLKSETRYYLDDTAEIRVGDVLDGRTAVGVEEYTDGLGRLEGYLVYVV